MKNDIKKMETALEAALNDDEMPPLVSRGNGNDSDSDENNASREYESINRNKTIIQNSSNNKTNPMCQYFCKS